MVYYHKGDDNMKVTINLENDTLTLNTDCKTSISELTTILMTSQLEVMNQAIEDIPIEELPPIKEYIFDQVNLAMSEVLARFAPEIDMRPDITEEAILDLEFQKAFKSINKSKPKQ